MPGTQVSSLGWEDPLEEGMATHSSILAWRIPWTEEPGGLQSTGLQRVRQDLATKTTRTIPAFQGPWKTVYVNASYTRKTTRISGMVLLTVCNQPEYTPMPAPTLVQWRRMNLHDFYFTTAWLFLTKNKHAPFPFPPKYLIYLSLLVISVLEVYHDKWLAVPLI